MEKYIKYFQENPDATQVDAVKHFGVSRQRISQICKKIGVKPKSAYLSVKASSRDKTQKQLFNVGFTDPNGDPLAASHMGQITELLIARDLMVRGFQVFKSISPVGQCDLVALHENKVARIEVRSATYDKKGRFVFAYPGSPEKYDILAVGTKIGEIKYYCNEGFEFFSETSENTVTAIKIATEQINKKFGNYKRN